MEQRREPRIQDNQPAWITIYGPVDTRIPARVRNLSGRGVGLEVGQPVAVGSAVKIELPDSLLLGEVIYCRQAAQLFHVGLELDQAVNSLVALSQSVHEFAEGSGPQQTHAVNHADRQHQQ
jgi:hypothetical protein